MLKALVGSALATGVVQAKIRSAKQTAGIVSLLMVCAVVAAIAGAVFVAAGVFFALRPLMEDYQAALAVGGGFLVLTALAALLALARLRRGLPGAARAAGAVEGPDLAAVPRRPGPSRVGQDPLVQLMSESIQSPVVMTALALGVVVGRMTRRGRRD